MNKKGRLKVAKKDGIKIYDIMKIINKIIELQEAIELELKKVKNVTRRKKLKKLCKKALKKKSDSSLAALREHLFKL